MDHISLRECDLSRNAWSELWSQLYSSTKSFARGWVGEGTQILGNRNFKFKNVKPQKYCLIFNVYYLLTTAHTLTFSRWVAQINHNWQRKRFSLEGLCDIVLFADKLLKVDKQDVMTNSLERLGLKSRPETMKIKRWPNQGELSFPAVRCLYTARSKSFTEKNGVEILFLWFF